MQYGAVNIGNGVDDGASTVGDRGNAGIKQLGKKGIGNANQKMTL